MAASYLVCFLSLLGSRQTTKSEWSVTFKCTLTFRTVGSCPAIFTNTETCHMVAMPAVFTGAAQLAAEPKVPKWADWLNENKIHHHVGVINRQRKSWGKQTSKTRNMQQTLTMCYTKPWQTSGTEQSSDDPLRFWELNIKSYHSDRDFPCIPVDKYRCRFADHTIHHYHRKGISLHIPAPSGPLYTLNIKKVIEYVHS